MGFSVGRYYALFDKYASYEEKKNQSGKGIDSEFFAVLEVEFLRPKSGDRSQETEVRSPETEGRSQKIEVRNLKLNFLNHYLQDTLCKLQYHSNTIILRKNILSVLIKTKGFFYANYRLFD